MPSTDSRLAFSSLTPLHWLGILMALVSAAVDLVFGVSFLQHWMALMILLATAGLVAELATDRSRLADFAVAALDTAAAHPTWDKTFDGIRSYLQAVATGETPSGVDGTTTISDHPERQHQQGDQL